MAKQTPKNLHDFATLCERYDLIARFTDSVIGYNPNDFIIEDDGDQYVLHDRQGQVLLGFDYSSVSKPWFYCCHSYAYFNLKRWDDFYQDY